MSIKWHRDAKRVNPRRDNPRAPKDVKPKRQPKKGLPRFPEVYKPVVSLPFVKAVNYTTFSSNLSAAGLSSVIKIADDNGLSIGTVRWIRSTHDELDCPPVAKGSIYRVCDVLAEKTWPNLDSFIASARATADGIWAVSHVNCRCHITVKMFDPANPNMYALYEVYTDPMEGAGRGNTVAAGFGWAEGTISEDQLASPDFGEITDLNKMDSSDDSERGDAKRKHDTFDKKVRPSSSEWFTTAPEEMPTLPEGRPITAPAVGEPAPAPALPETTQLEQPAPSQTAEETEEEKRKREEEEKGFLG